MKRAVKTHVLFGCTVGYSKGYYLKSIEGRLPLFNTSVEDRPLEYGDNTNGYLWQICYKDRSVSLEWCHGVFDGRAGLSFFSSALAYYFGTEIPVKVSLELRLEPFYDKNEKSIPKKARGKGFSVRSLPLIKNRGYKTDCHILKADTRQVLTAAKKIDSTPAAVLPPLFSMALRRHLDPRAKNRNVRSCIVIDCRTPLKHETMHNAIISKNITYVDRFDTMDFSTVSTVYRGILDLATLRENVVVEATNSVDILSRFVYLRPRLIRRLAVRGLARCIKHSDSNFTFTYLGRLSLPEDVLDRLEGFNIAAVDFGGTLILNICENFKDKEIIPDFIDICEKVGIHFERTDTLPFEQANMRIKKIRD